MGLGQARQPAEPGAHRVLPGEEDRARQDRQDRQAAEDLRRLLGEAGVSTRDLNDVISQLRQFDSSKLYDDPKALEELHAAALNKLKEFDFNLRKKAGADNSGCHICLRALVSCTSL